MIVMNPNVKYILKDKSIHTLDATKASALEIEKNMEKSDMIPSSLSQPCLKEFPRNEVVRNEGPLYELLPSQYSRMEERDRSNIEIINEHEQSNPFPKLISKRLVIYCFFDAKTSSSSYSPS
jgi:hypothetical protein